jgi:hypothetical protein
MSLTPLFAQETSATTIPHLVRFTGTFRPANGLPAGPTESATLSVYAEEHSGTPLWQETQNVAIDVDGHYTAVLGATQNDGVPLDLFMARSPQWLGVMFNRPGETEQPRVQLVSVPYAMRAADAETLGGRPASAYVLDPNAATMGSANSGTTPVLSDSAKSLKPRNISGTMNYIPYFTDNTNDLGNSVLYQSGSYVGVGTTIPSAPLDLEAVIPSAAMFVARYTGSSSQAPTSLPMAVRTARGTSSIPSPVQQGDILGPYVTQAFDGTGFASAGQIIYWADQNWTSSQHGSYLTLTTVADGTTSATERMRITNAGNVGVGTASPASKLDVAGDINFSGIIRYQGTPAFSLNGTSNTGIGYFTLNSNAFGSENTAVGAQALETTAGTSNGTEGSGNTAIGWGALETNTTGDSNIAIGRAAGSSITATSNNIDIGATGVNGDSGAIRIGTSGTQTSLYLAGVTSSPLANQATLVLDTATGQVGYTSSSRRYKEDIQDMSDASSGLMRLRPVTFRYKQPANDGSKPIQYGLIAEEVAEVYPDLVAHSADGQIETVKYQLLDSMLLNEVQKQERQIGQQQEHIQRLQEQNRALEERLEKLEAAIAGSR